MEENVYISGEADGFPTVNKLDSEGNVDRSFGEQGALSTSESGVFRISLDEEQNIYSDVSSGSFEDNVSNSEFCVRRYSKEGTVDTDFGNSHLEGTACHEGISPTSLSFVSGVITLPNEKLLVLGQSRFPSGVAVGRLTASGERDVSYAEGKMTFLSGMTIMRPPVASPAGALTFAVQKRNSDQSSTFGVFQLDPSGQPDALFGDRGFVALADADDLADVALLPNGDLLAAGSRSVTEGGKTRSQRLLARIGPDGTLNEDFGEGGIFGTPPEREGIQTRYIRILETEGGLVLVEASHKLGQNRIVQYAAVRYHTDRGEGQLEGSFPVAAEDTPTASARLAVFPNPTSGRATVRVGLAQAGQVRAEVLDLLGRRVAVLADGAQQAGVLDLTWEASRAAPGVYLVRVQSMAGVEVRRITVMR